MTIDRRLRSASNALREVDLAVPQRVPKGSMARTPAMALPVLMLVFGAALVVAGLDRTPGSEPVPESASVVLEANVAGDAATMDRIGDTVTAEGSYDIEGELQLIRELRRRPSLVVSSAPPDVVAVAAPDANAELELINALVSRPSAAATTDDAPAGATVEADVDPATSRPIAGLS